MVGHLSQYFCEKNSLEEELAALRVDNSSKLVSLKEEEIRTATRNAYLYAMGVVIATFYTAINHTWTFYSSHKMGMMARILMAGAIYKKVYMCNIAATIVTVYLLGATTVSLYHRKTIHWTHCKPCFQ